ncbi:hypothetical protein [Thermus scotoductus]|nr:hypothetical protein [Thermus scotoductus]
MTERSLRPLTEEEYLALEEANPVRHELGIRFTYLVQRVSWGFGRSTKA